MINSLFDKTMKSLGKHRDIKLVKTDEKKSKLISEPNYHTTKWFSENLSAIEKKKAKVKMNKPVYLGMSILDMSKTLMYKFWYEYTKPKYGDRAKLCYTGTDSIIAYIMSEDFYRDISDDVERWFDTSNYDVNGKRPLPINKKKEIIWLFQRWIRRKDYERILCT